MTGSLPHGIQHSLIEYRFTVVEGVSELLVHHLLTQLREPTLIAPYLESQPVVGKRQDEPQGEAAIQEC
jgi:hypothetical protein